jgi:hypothetical protein
MTSTTVHYCLAAVVTLALLGGYEYRQRLDATRVCDVAVTEEASDEEPQDLITPPQSAPVPDTVLAPWDAALDEIHWPKRETLDELLLVIREKRTLALEQQPSRNHAWGFHSVVTWFKDSAELTSDLLLTAFDQRRARPRDACRRHSPACVR